jgi:type 1 fimbria pilin
MASCALENAAVPINSALALRVGQITVGRDLPIGSEVYRQTFDAHGSRSIICTPGSDEITLKYSVHMSSPPLPVAGNIYPTNLSGIGVQFSDAENRPFSLSTRSLNCPGPDTCVFQSHDQQTFTLSLIKVSANVEVGAISGAALPVVDISYDVKGHQLPLRKVRLSGQLRVVSQTCQTSNVQVNLGTHSVREFERTASLPWQDFAIVLSHCPAFHGYYSVASASLGRDGVLNSNKISFQIDPTQPAVSSSEGILSLTSYDRAEVKAAEGIGLQIANDNGHPIKLSVLLDSGIHLRPQDGGSYFIRLKARYIKSGNGIVQSGPANSTAIFTINYQ